MNPTVTYKSKEQFAGSTNNDSYNYNNLGGNENNDADCIYTDDASSETFMRSLKIAVVNVEDNKNSVQTR